MSYRPLPGWLPRRNSSDPELGGSGGSSFGSNTGPPPNFAFRNANWLAHLFQPSSFAPRSDEYPAFLSNAKNYLESLTHFRHPTLQTLGTRGLQDCYQFGHSFALLAPRLRSRFNVLPWRILIIPSGDMAMKFGDESALRSWLEYQMSEFEEVNTSIPKRGISIEEWEQSKTLGDELLNFQKYDKGHADALYALDKALSSNELLQEIQPRDSSCACLVFQLNSNLAKTIYIEDMFPLFGLALSNANSWPGALVWNLRNEAVFLPLPRSISRAKAAISWMVKSVSAHQSSGSTLKSMYSESGFEPTSAGFVEPLNLIHMSDLHLGNSTSNRRMTTVKNRVSQLVGECASSNIVPVVTGDLMDTPSPDNFEKVLDFIHFLDNLRVERPVVVLGNHDVRRLGILDSKLEEALRLYLQPVVWFEKSRVGLLCFNSVRTGNLARGHIGENELIALGNELDRDHKRAKEYTLLALLHHHPTPVEVPDWYVRQWYLRWLGDLLDRTVELADAETFLTWCSMRNITALLHGHKHIPRVSEKGGIAILGCGSTTGKLGTKKPGETYMSINFLNVDASSGRISCRLRVEKIAGAGLTESSSHEILYRGLVKL